MKVCLSTKTLWRTKLKKALRLIAKEGYDGAEIWVEHILRDISSLEDFKIFLKKLDLEITLHAPAGDLNISSTDDDIRRVSVKKIGQAIKMASKLGIDLITIHPGRKTSSNNDYREHWQLQFQNIKYLTKLAEEYKVHLGVENMECNGYEGVTHPRDLKKILSTIESDYLGVTLDIAHASTLQDLNLYEYIREIHEVIHIHLSDSTLGKTHLPLGYGDLPLSSIVRELEERFNVLLVIEGYIPGQERDVLHSNLRWWRKLTNQGIVV